MRIAVIGAQGFVGSVLLAALEDGSRDVVGVTRETHEAARGNGTYDVLINAAMPSKRFWAKMNPQADFVESVEKTAQLLYDWKWNKFVLISSISARTQRDSIYGRHKHAAEDLCLYAENLVVRLGPMYADTLTTGVLIDMVHDRTVFVSGDSQYCFAPLEWVASSIIDNLHRSGVFETGACNGISLRDVALAIGSKSQFQGPIDHQIVIDPPPSAPLASNVIAFAKRLSTRIS